jgi:DNA polymerase III alpha subunit (gram-positive type)
LPILGHNISFDIDFLYSNGINFKENIYIDTFLIANFLDFNEKSLSLESLACSYKIEFI